MSRQTWMADILADAFRGVKGYQLDAWHGWTTLGNAYFEPVGLLDHHTGGGGTYANILRYMMESSPLAPSCNWASSPPINGVVRITVTCAGRANHAGRGRLPWVPQDTGNFRLIGGEHHNDGRTPWPQQQREGIEIADAAMLKYLGLGTDRVAFHKTYAGYRGKWDMHTLSLAEHQAQIGEYLSSPPATAPAIIRSPEDSMYEELIRAAYRRTRHNDGDKQNARVPGGWVSTYDVAVQDPSGWRSWLELLARADVHHGTGAAKLDVVRSCEIALAREAGL